MISISEAFDKFRGNLETTDTENQSASARQRRIRRQLDDSPELDIDHDFLTGAYIRHTKTRPLRDVDIMIVLRDRTHLDRHPHDILEIIRKVLVPHYGEKRVICDRMAVRVDFGVTVVDDISDEVMSFDVVPAFESNGYYLIPDDLQGEWIATNPKEHQAQATAANQAFSEWWKPLVKMTKKWNETAGRPVQPSFLIEVMALEMLGGVWTGDHPRELRQFFASAASKIDKGWPDPAHVGPDVSDVLDSDPAKMARAQRALREAEAACTEAIRLNNAGKSSEALRTWRALFGPLFQLS